MSATDVLRKDHEQIKRLEKIILKCYNGIYEQKTIPFSDLEKINLIILEFLDSIHYSREEDSYFACVGGYGTLKKEIRVFMIEHEFSRRIAKNIAKYLQQWKNGTNTSEPVARFLRTYSIYLKDHLSKEEEFFSKTEKEVLSQEEETAMFEQFQSQITITKKIQEIIKEIDYLEQQPWFKN
ncbi:MAG TPA: hemerythrin domain-containing protein [Nitrosopumilaceae archaeon]|nr:hemerythrin domain-containing protein [Nitrosopumilaceae archaeon]